MTELEKMIKKKLDEVKKLTIKDIENLPYMLNGTGHKKDN